MEKSRTLTKHIAQAIALVFFAVLFALFLFACGNDEKGGNGGKLSSLAIPKNLRIVDEVLMWDEVKGAESYDVYINDEIYEAEKAELDIFLLTATPKTYKIFVRAVGNPAKVVNSDWSQTIWHNVRVASNLEFRAINDNTEYSVYFKNNSVVTGKVVIPEAHSDGKPITRLDFLPSGSGITAVIIPDTVTDIGNSAFKNCTNLTRVRMPAHVTKLGSYAFEGCEKLKKIDLPEDLVEISYYAFRDCKSLTEITIPRGVKKMDDGVFSGCSSLASIELPAELEEFDGYNVFGNCDSLVTMTIGEGSTLYKTDGNCLIRKSDNSLVAGCVGSVIPSYVTSILRYAFYGCTGLKAITIPSGVVKIEGFAFVSCYGLEEVSLPDTLTEIGGRIFVDYANLKKITVDDGNPVFKGDGNCVIRRSDNQLVIGCMGSDIPDYVESIGDLAFAFLPITHITVKNDSAQKEEGVLAFPEGVKYIGEWLGDRELLTVHLPDSVTELSQKVFSNCDNLETVLISAESKLVFDKSISFNGATIYTSMNEIPDSWYRDSNHNYTYISGSCIVTDCVFGEDNGRTYVDSVVFSNDIYNLRSYMISPYRSGYKFTAWAKDSRDGTKMGLTYYKRENFWIPNLTGNTISRLDDVSINRLSDGTVLYAVWEPI